MQQVSKKKKMQGNKQQVEKSHLTKVMATRLGNHLSFKRPPFGGIGESLSF